MFAVYLFKYSRYFTANLTSLKLNVQYVMKVLSVFCVLAYYIQNHTFTGVFVCVCVCVLAVFYRAL